MAAADNGTDSRTRYLAKEMTYVSSPAYFFPSQDIFQKRQHRKQAKPPFARKSGFKARPKADQIIRGPCADFGICADVEWSRRDRPRGPGLIDLLPPIGPGPGPRMDGGCPYPQDYDLDGPIFAGRRNDGRRYDHDGRRHRGYMPGVDDREFQRRFPREDFGHFDPRCRPISPGFRPRGMDRRNERSYR